MNYTIDKINENNGYNELIEYYDNILNKDKSIFKSTNDECTPIKCVTEMINTIPDDFWKNKYIKILDPCCGCGNFFLVILTKLIKYHNIQYILENILYFNDLNSERIKIVKTIFLNDKYKLNITEGDFLIYKNDIKFDLIVANPPYAKILDNGKRASKNHNLIGLFINKSLELLNSNGLLLYITPDNWMSFADRNVLITKLTKLQIHHINIHIAKKYFKVGSSFVWYLIENTVSYKDIKIEGIWKGKEYSDCVKSEIRKFIPLYYNRIIQSILNKTIDKNNKKFDIMTSSDLHKYTKRELISNTKDDIFKYKLIHTPKQTVWSKRPHKFQEGFKVFISTTTYYSIFIDNCGMTQSIAFILCKDEQEANLFKKILEHPLYCFINNICRYGNFNNIRILQNFPYCIKYEDIYKDFKINKEEIKFIESS